jgi:CRP-like cAMP-binding protein
MAKSPLFAGLSENEYTKIAVLARPRTFNRDEMIFLQGQPLRTLTLIRSGSVKITQVSSAGSEVILWMRGCGSVVGMLTEPVSNQSPCSARAMEHCTVLVWEYSTLEKLMAEYPQVRKNASSILTSRLGELEERFREVSTEKVATRLSLTLLRLLKQIGKTVEEGIEVSLSREELAQMTGTTIFTISRIISKWSEIGLVLPRRESVVILDQAQLALVGHGVY